MITKPIVHRLLTVGTLALLGVALTACSSGQCKTNSDCATSSGHVCSAGSCVACAGDSDCPMNHKCNNQTACVECLTSSDCAKGQLCQSNACVVGCDAKSTCPANTVCNIGLKACVPCNADKDCMAPTGRCDQSTHSCVGCTRDDDCAAGQVCHAQTCTSGCSSVHVECPMGQVCNLSMGACVECLTDASCKGASPRCDASQGKCVACLPSSDNCAAGTYCAGTICTPGCASDAGCTLGQVCNNHACTSGCNAQHACPGGQGCCDLACVSVLSDAKNCGGCGVVCPSGSGCCGGACVPVTTITNCGACGASCPDVANGTRTCKAGACGIGACSSGFSDCNKDPTDGCEADLRSAMSCGACGNVCPSPTNAQASCTSGQCGLGTCNTGFADCDVVAGNGCEVSLATDAKNCGKCGSLCAPVNAMGGCKAGICTIGSCATGFSDCDSNAANGCEINNQTDSANCGTCGNMCSTGKICTRGQCVIAQIMGSLAGTQTFQASRGITQNGFFDDPSTQKYYFAPGYSPNSYILEYSSLTDFQNNANSRQINLAVNYESTYHVALGGYFYYLQAGTSTISKVRVSDGTLAAQGNLPNTQNNGGVFNWFGNGSAAFYVDAGNTLYALYQNNSNQMTLSQIDPGNLGILQSWNIPASRSSLGWAFMAYGFVYFSQYFYSPHMFAYFNTATGEFNQGYSNNLTTVTNDYITDVFWDPATNRLFEQTNGQSLVYPNAVH